jgi:excisionase family DNA binding protein
MLTVNEVAKALEVSPNTVRRMIECGEIPAIDLNRHGIQRTYRIAEESLKSLTEKDKKNMRTCYDVEINIKSCNTGDTVCRCGQCGKSIQRKDALSFHAISVIPVASDSDQDYHASHVFISTFACNIECLRDIGNYFVENEINKLPSRLVGE